VALDYRRPPSWRVPVAIVTAVVLLAIAGTILALNAIADDVDRDVSGIPIKAKEPTGARTDAEAKAPTKEQAQTTEEPAKTDAPAEGEKTEGKQPAGKQDPAPGSGTELVKRGVLYTWPRELRAFTVVLLSGEDRASAESFARSASEGMPAKIGVLRADDFESLPKGFFVVFAGQYEDRASAEKAAARLAGRFSGGFPQLVQR